jgi:hypothetical protein
VRAAALAVLLVVGAAGGAPTARHCRTVVVEPGRSIEAAVLRARPCDWVLVAPGVYHGSVTIRTPELHLRGVDRNRVVLDGGHRAANGIVVAADGVTIENLTVRNFDRRAVNDEETGNELLWRDVHGWSARWVTAYDTGLLRVSRASGTARRTWSSQAVNTGLGTSCSFGSMIPKLSTILKLPLLAWAMYMFIRT